LNILKRANRAGTFLDHGETGSPDNMTEGEAPKGLSAKLDKKRKRQAEESTKQDKPETAPAGASAAGGDESNKKKRKKNKKNKQQPEQDGKSQDRKGGVDESIGKMDGGLLADYFAQRAQKLDKELSAVELSDLSVPGVYQVLQFLGYSGVLTGADSAFLDTTSFSDSRTLDKLPDFLKTFSPKSADLSKASEKKGTPHTLVISAAALRAADVVRYEKLTCIYYILSTFIGADNSVLQGTPSFPDKGSHCR
jgi:protein CMS1